MRLLSQRFYKYIFLFLSTAGLWAGLQFFRLLPSTLSVCPVKSIAGIPCPGCGTTRAGIAFLNGHFYEALLINPLGLVVCAVLAFTGVMLVVDLTTGQTQLKNLFMSADHIIKKPAVFVPIITLILLNWGWSITKAL
ncbi:MAG: DUF2752 domain-containing protein [Cyclobacteriaceae bacterium]